MGEDPGELRPEWLEAWHRIGDAVRWGKWAAHHYVSRLQAVNPRLRYGFAYAVKETFRSSPKYYLILTRSEDAVLAMNDFICTEDEDLFTKKKRKPRWDNRPSLVCFERTRRLSTSMRWSRICMLMASAIKAAAGMI